MKRLLLFLFFAFMPAFAQLPEVEPNNSYSTATPVATSPTQGVGTVWPVGDVDFWRLILPGGATLHAVLTPPAGVTQFLYIYNQVGQIVASSTLPGGQVQDIYVRNNSMWGFYYYAVVRSPSGVASVDDYTLALSW